MSPKEWLMATIDWRFILMATVARWTPVNSDSTRRDPRAWTDRRPPFLGAFPTSGIYFFPKKKPAETELGGGSIFAGIF